jgi:hypothetical protein
MTVAALRLQDWALAALFHQDHFRKRSGSLAT